MSESTDKITKRDRKFIIGICIASFVGTVVGLFSLFQYYQADLYVSVIMSVVSGGIVVWAILSGIGLLKEFSIKGGAFELTAKLKDEIYNVRQDVTDTRREMIEKFADIKLSISNVQSSKSESSIINHYHQTKGEFNAALKDSGIPESKIEPDKDIPKQHMEKINSLLIRLKALEDAIDQPIKLTISEMMTRANYYFYKDDYAKAKKLYLNILTSDPENKDALFNLAYSQDQLKEYEEGIQGYKKVLEMEPKNDVVMNNIGVAYSKLRDNKNAVMWYNKVLEINPKYISAILNLGKRHRSMGDLDKALEITKKAYDIEPNNSNVLIMLATTHLHMRNFKKSKEFANTAVNITPKTKDGKINNIIANLILGNHSKASDLCDVLLSENPDDAAVLYNKACSKALLKEDTESLELLKKAISLDVTWKDAIKTDPDFDSLRNNPKFKELLDS